MGSGLEITGNAFKQRLLLLTCKLLDGDFWLGYKGKGTVFYNNYYFGEPFF